MRSFSWPRQPAAGISYDSVPCVLHQLLAAKHYLLTRVYAMRVRATKGDAAVPADRVVPDRDQAMNWFAFWVASTSEEVVQKVNRRVTERCTAVGIRDLGFRRASRPVGVRVMAMTHHITYWEETPATLDHL